MNTLFKRTLTVLTAIILVTVVLAVIPSALGGDTRAQPPNAMDLLLEGEGVADGDSFGWNVSFIGDINDDGYEDLGVGAPFDDTGGADAGAVYIYYGGPGAISKANISAEYADLAIFGTADNDWFGWDLDGAGDYNNDGVDDLIVGAPGWGANDLGRIYIFAGSDALMNMTADNATASEQGRTNWAYLGFAVTGCGDLDGDGNDDAAASATGDDEIVIIRGYTPVPPMYVDMWDDNKTTMNVVDFNVEVNNTDSDVNTWGVYLPTIDSWDGWDWDVGQRVYGGAGTSGTIEYWSIDEGNPGSDTGDLTPGGQAGVGGFIQNIPASTYESIAWGCQVNITNAMNTSINNGHRVYFSFDYEVSDPASAATEEPCYVKARIGYTNSTMNYLGTDQDGQTFWIDVQNGFGGWEQVTDATPEIWHYMNPSAQMFGGTNFGVQTGTYLGDVTPYVTRAGSLYIDAGLAYLTGSQGNGADEGIRGRFTNFTMWIETGPEYVWITGGVGFGWDVDGGLDVSGDGTPDLIVSNIVSDPFLGLNDDSGAVFVFPGKAVIDYATSNDASDVYRCGVPGAMGGYSIAMVPDMNGDSHDEVLAGGPGADNAYLWYGRDPPTYSWTYYAPWDDNITNTPNTVAFETEVNNTDADLNTWGIAEPDDTVSDDGWDWDAGIWAYGGDGNTGGNTLEYYSPDESNPGSDTGTLTPAGDRSIGCGIWNLGGNDVETLAWGVQFNITIAMNNSVNAGDIAYLQLGYSVWDHSGGGTEEPCYIKARAGNADANMTYLGSDLDGGTFTMQGGTNFIDREPELWHYRNPSGALGGGANFGLHTGTFMADITALINETGSFYIDFGIKISTGGFSVGGDEGIEATFDDIAIVFVPAADIPTPDVTFSGPVNDSFGHSVSFGYELNSDAIPDIVIGAPGNNSVNGVDSGAVYAFAGASSMPAAVPYTTALHENWGEFPGDHFGYSVAGDGYLTGGAFSGVAVGAVFSNDTIDFGKVYYYEIPTTPVIDVTSPNGGEVVNGTITLNATATDPDNNIDAQGVRFYIMPDGGSSWTLINNDPTATGNDYSVDLDTTLWADGNYWVYANVTDDDGFMDSDMSDNMFTIDNPWMPSVDFVYPPEGAALNGSITLNATAADVDGILDLVIGMRFYWSTDNATWTLLGNDAVATGNLYEILGVNTTTMPDGTIYFKANITDDEGFLGYDTTFINLDNPNRPPTVDLNESLTIGQEIMGTIDLVATADDPDGNINASGVTFYMSTDGAVWTAIGNDATPDAGGNYTLQFDTNTVDDGIYWFGARATDTDGLTAFDFYGSFQIHNDLFNAPIVLVTYPNGGEEVFGNIWVTATVTDLEDNIDLAKGVSFFYRSDVDEPWVLINKTHAAHTGNTFRVAWDTWSVKDGLHYLIKAEATDLDNLTGNDTSNAEFKVHNVFNNPPEVDITYPTGGLVVNGTINIEATVSDLEDNIDPLGVAFYYYKFPNSLLNESVDWQLIGNDQLPDANGTYTLPFDTTTVDDGLFYRIKAMATDTTTMTGMGFSGTFSIRNEDEHAPIIEVLNPNGGEVLSELAPIAAAAYDLDNDLDLTKGVEFYYSADKTDWTYIGAVTAPTGDEFGMDWDTNVTSIPNGDYWLRATVQDLLGNTAEDTSDAVFTIDNYVEEVVWNAPFVTITGITAGTTYSGVLNLTATVTDIDADLDTVEFYYIRNGSEVKLTGTVGNDGDTYWISWDTTAVADSDNFQIKVVATDLQLLTDDATSATFTIQNQQGTDGPVVDGGDGGDESFLEQYGLCLILLIIILVIIVIIIIVVVIILVTRKKGVDVEIGPFEKDGEAVEGDLKIVSMDKEFTGTIGNGGMGLVRNVKADLMGIEATAVAIIDGEKYEVPVVLSDEDIVKLPAMWIKKYHKKADEEDGEVGEGDLKKDEDLYKDDKDKSKLPPPPPASADGKSKKGKKGKKKDEKKEDVDLSFDKPGDDTMSDEAAEETWETDTPEDLDADVEPAEDVPKEDLDEDGGDDDLPETEKEDLEVLDDDAPQSDEDFEDELQDIEEPDLDIEDDDLDDFQLDIDDD